MDREGRPMVSVPSKRMEPLRLLKMPMIDLSVVVLPAPLRPKKCDDLAWVEIEAHAVEDMAFAVPGLQLADAQDWGGGGRACAAV